MASSTALTGKVTVVCPAGMVAVAGTVSSEVSLLVRFAVRFCEGAWVMESVAVDAFAPAASENVDGERERARPVVFPPPPEPVEMVTSSNAKPSRELEPGVALGL